MIESVDVIGVRGRVGSAVSARLAERGVELRGGGAALVLLCVPDRAIAEVAAHDRARPVGRARERRHAPRRARPACAPLLASTRCRRFTHARGPEQLDGAWAAVTGETDEAVEVAHRARASCSACGRSRSPTTAASLYHAGAAIASNYLVTLRRAAGELLAEADVPDEALDPLMRRVIENDFELTGPIERGDWETVERHRAAIASRGAPPARGLRRARRASPPVTRSSPGSRT